MTAKLRNIAIIAHVDHGKTTLVDGLLAQAGALNDRGGQTECILDRMDQERERGITITSKVCAVDYQGLRINIIDTPGHADFGGEVERVVRMADGCLLLVDAFEGVMPQTRFVLGKAIACGLRPILVVNKIDRPGGDPAAAVDGVFDLMVELGANDQQLDFPVLYGSGRDRYMNLQPEPHGGDLIPLLDAIAAHIPGPPIDAAAPLQVQVSNIEYSSFVGRIAVGRIYAGNIEAGMAVAVVAHEGAAPRRTRVLQLHRPQALGREEVTRAAAGDIVFITGLDDIAISQTVCHLDEPVALPPIPIDEPTISMTIGVNTSPLAGLDGKPIQSRELLARLRLECESNVALRVAETDRPDTFEVSGRGLLHLSVLIETMRREGIEVQVGPPQVIEQRDATGQRLEPIELVAVDVPEEMVSRVMALLLERRGEVVAISTRGARQHLELTIPSRCTFGLRTALLTATQGEGILHAIFHAYEPYRGDVSRRKNGTMISMCDGQAVGFALFNLQERGRLFIEPGEPLYEGRIVGEHAKENDITVNPSKGKKLTNIRNSGGADEAIRLITPWRMTLEEALEYIAPDEMVEVTPHHLRLRKTMLSAIDRKRQDRDG